MELSRDFYVGIVEDNKDPNRKGRIKVRVQTLYHNIPIEDIPYAYPFASLSGKEFQVPAIGKLVNVLFLSDDLYSPYYIYSENYNENLQRKLKSLDDGNYADFTAILFDESTNIFVEGKELTIDQLLNKITINNDSINLELKDNLKTVNLGGKDADQDAVLGTNFFRWMDQFINELMSPFSMIGNMGAPVLKPTLLVLCQQYLRDRPNFLSKNVKITDNGAIKPLSRSYEVVNNKNDIDLVVPPEENPEYQQALLNAIHDQNSKACNDLKEATPSSSVPLNKEDADPANLKIVPPDWITGTKTKSVLENLHPEMKPYATAFINKCRAAGIKLELTSGYRSISEQARLYDIDTANIDKGIYKSRKAAKPGSSYHNFGLAIDVALRNSDDWATVGSIGKSLGFRWGFDFKNPRPEVWHFDMPFDYSSAQLLQKFQNGDIKDGYVNIGENAAEEDDIQQSSQQLNGQDYQVNSETIPNSSSINQPCPGVNKFNRSDAGAMQSNEDGKSFQGSDESEEASKPKYENVKPKCADGSASSFEAITSKVIDTLEGGYFHPRMMKDLRYLKSGETMFGIDRKNFGADTTGAFNEFWSIIDTAGAATTWKWNYRGGDLEPKLVSLVVKMMKPRYEKYCKSYFTPEANQIINSDCKLMFNFVYATWNGAGWFRKWARLMNNEISNGNTDIESLRSKAIGARTSYPAQNLIGQSGRKLEQLFNSPDMWA